MIEILEVDGVKVNKEADELRLELEAMTRKYEYLTDTLKDINMCEKHVLSETESKSANEYMSEEYAVDWKEKYKAIEDAIYYARRKERAEFIADIVKMIEKREKM